MMTIVSPMIRVAINPTRKYPHHGHPPLSYPLMYANTAPISSETNVVQLSCVRVISDAAFLI